MIRRRRPREADIESFATGCLRNCSRRANSVIVKSDVLASAQV
jgi:hypothetical protein